MITTAAAAAALLLLMIINLLHKGRDGVRGAVSRSICNTYTYNLCALPFGCTFLTQILSSSPLNPPTVFGLYYWLWQVIPEKRQETRFHLKTIRLPLVIVWLLMQQWGGCLCSSGRLSRGVFPHCPESSNHRLTIVGGFNMLVFFPSRQKILRAWSDQRSEG